MSDHKLAEALRTGLEMTQELLAIKREALGDDYRLTRSYWKAEREIQAALAAHEAEQQAGEAVAVVHSISGQSRTEDAYATVQILNSAGKGYWELPMKEGTKLFTRPLEPLTQTKLIALWADKSDGPSNAEIVSFARAIERAHGIGITKDTK